MLLRSGRFRYEYLLPSFFGFLLALYSLMSAWRPSTGRLSPFKDGGLANIDDLLPQDLLDQCIKDVLAEFANMAAATASS